MRYLVEARLKRRRAEALQEAIDDGSLGTGSIAGDEYLRNMAAAREEADGTIKWVEVCYCPTPLQEERPYWEEYFDLVAVKDAHARSRCRHENGAEPWACSDCDCTERLEERLRQTGTAFSERLEERVRRGRGVRDGAVGQVGEGTARGVRAGDQVAGRTPGS